MMRVVGVIWLRQIVDKLEVKHGVSTDEVEEVLASQPQFRFLERGRVEGEHVYAAYGRTSAGRYLTIILIRKMGGRGLVITARDMDRKERRQYGR